MLNDLRFKADVTKTVLIDASRLSHPITGIVVTLLGEKIAEVHTNKHPYLYLSNDIRWKGDAMQTVNKVWQLGRLLRCSKLLEVLPGLFFHQPPRPFSATL